MCGNPLSGLWRCAWGGRGGGVVAGVDSRVQRGICFALLRGGGGEQRTFRSLLCLAVGRRFTPFNPGGNQLWLLCFFYGHILVSVFAGKAQQRQMHISPGAFCPGTWCVQETEEQFYRSNQQLVSREQVESPVCHFSFA